MEEKKYLRWQQKIYYGMGDFASNSFGSFLGSFILIYLTDSVGLNAGIVGTLIFVSKILDGITDVFFGSMIDRTNSKMGKARPWMFWSTFPLGIFIILQFAIPEMDQTLQYAYFFVVFVLINAIFYTANNIAYASLTAFITRNSEERVQLGTIRFIFAFLAMMMLSAVTMPLVNALGGGADGWRNTAILYSVFAMILNTLSCLLVKELPEETEIINSDTPANKKNQ